MCEVEGEVEGVAVSKRAGRQQVCGQAAGARVRKCNGVKMAEGWECMLEDEVCGNVRECLAMTVGWGLWRRRRRQELWQRAKKAARGAWS